MEIMALNQWSPLMTPCMNWNRWWKECLEEEKREKSLAKKLKEKSVKYEQKEQMKREKGSQRKPEDCLNSRNQLLDSLCGFVSITNVVVEFVSLAVRTSIPAIIVITIP